MKKDKKKAAITKIAAAGAFLAFQAIPETLSAQEPAIKADSVKQNAISKRQNFFFKFANTKLAEQKLTVVALLNGEPVLKLGSSELYQMNTQTGDIQQVPIEEYNKLSIFPKIENYGKIYSAKERPLNVAGLKISYKHKESSYFTRNQIELLGVDKDGHEIFQNNKKEKFFFDPATGDMVDYVGHVALLR